ncbi:MAG: hypothetical protein Q8K64_08235 [Sediminibacterium sp.]|nr:hypothetical protein [Sediminibacterium sp.]
MNKYNKKANVDQDDYLTFPIILLSDNNLDIKERLRNVICYCLYERYLKIPSNYNTDKAKREALIELNKKVTLNPVRIEHCNESKYFDIGEVLFNSIPSSSVKTSIKKKIIWEFRFDNSKHSECNVIELIAFAALRSIIQRQKYKKLTHDYLLSRMAGSNTVIDTLPDWLVKYRNRHHIDNLKKQLQLNWGLKIPTIKGIRGIYVSFECTLDSLSLIAEKNKRKNKLKELALKKHEAHQKALKAIQAGNSIKTPPTTSYGLQLPQLKHI